MYDNDVALIVAAKQIAASLRSTQRRLALEPDLRAVHTPVVLSGARAVVGWLGGGLGAMGARVRARGTMATEPKT